MRYIGCGLALFVGINTEYFAQQGVKGWLIYAGLIAVAVALATIRVRRKDR